MVTTYSTPKIVVIIPTKNRPAALGMAISSVRVQTRPPDLLVIVGENDSDFNHLEKDFLLESHILLVNERTRNLSGALNTVITHLLEMKFNYDKTYIAILDDDDTWEPNYLYECIMSAKNNCADWIISGITRHENKSTNGEKLCIPDKLESSAFLTGNPHIQGSNLFIKLSLLLKAGCFDENLVSTTDRDLGIRLLNLNSARISIVKEHLVHHNAFNHNRLSTPGSQKKRSGLSEFYYKYNPLMSREERDKFLKRSFSLFKCELGDFFHTRGPI
jgi:glycosyltransferase involved in cell wall biosynthesis